MATKKACMDVAKRSRSPVVLEAEMFSEFQDWCLRTYGDSGKTKTVTRRKYNKIMQTLLQSDESDGVYVDNSHINAKFKFWVKSKGFQVGNVLGEHHKKGTSGKPVLYVPVCTNPVKKIKSFNSGVVALERLGVLVAETNSKLIRESAILLQGKRCAFR
ncbi:hypothetical protein NHX12_012812 [Muraenolepis orangiensis]|uniref:Nucleolar protein 4 n=1 Tax=Muraenolepis orangiensis TaxID=630683 RepID=A0A9Q0DCQ7_9TELE|nr:hypothetical protein NHX12_012812 [Muraenolepis orangiensis]